MKRIKVSNNVIRRMPRYLRKLDDLNAAGIERISSGELGRQMGLTPSQIRQDFSCFGEFGQQGYGYNVVYLHEAISKILGFDNTQETILIGAGNLGRAIATYTDFKGRGFNLIGVFDNNPAIIGQRLSNCDVTDIAELEDFCKEHHPTVAIVCVPKTAAEQLAGRLVELGIKGFWNFSHYDISLKYKQAVVENVHLSDSLMTLCYRVNNETE